MTTLREIARVEGSSSIREVTERYAVTSLRQLQLTFNNRNEVVYMDHVISRTQSLIRIRNLDGQETSVDVPTENLSSEQQEQVLDSTWNDTKSFLKTHWEEIKDGKIKAVDAGGALFHSVAKAICKIFAPFGGDSALGKIFEKLSEQKGRYFGAAVDDLIDFLKNESELNAQQIVGTLATVLVTSTYLPALSLGGTDAWTLTKEVGKAIGDTSVEGLEKIETLIGDSVGKVGEVVSAGADIAKSILDF